MAAVKLDLVPGEWQEIGPIAFLFDKSRLTNLEFTNTIGLPTGDVAASFMGVRNELQIFPAPAEGSWFVRCAAENAKLVYTAL